MKLCIKQLYFYDFRGSCGSESIKSPLDDRRFITRRNFWNRQALLAAVIHSDAVHTQKIQQIPKETDYRVNIPDVSRSTSNNSSQAQEFNVPDKLLNSLSHTTQTSSQGLPSQCDTPLFIIEHVKFTISPMVLENSLVSRFLLVLKTLD